MAQNPENPFAARHLQSKDIVRRPLPRTDIPEGGRTRDSVRKVIDILDGIRGKRINHASATLDTTAPQSSLGIDLQPGSVEIVSPETPPEFAPKLEKRISTEFREAEEGDLDGITALFLSYDSVRRSPNGRPDTDSNHAGHEDLNPYVPTNPRDPDQLANFKEALRKFYFGGKFDTVAKYTGEELKGVERYTEVCIVEDEGKKEIAGISSVLTEDPYAPPTDRERIAQGELKVVYSHMALVKDEYRRRKINSWFIGRFAQKFMIKEGCDQITSSIDQRGDWSPILKTAKSIGFALDWRPTGQYSYVDDEGKEIEGFRVILTKEDWLLKRRKVYDEAKERLGALKIDEV